MQRQEQGGKALSGTWRWGKAKGNKGGKAGDNCSSGGGCLPDAKCGLMFNNCLPVTQIRFHYTVIPLLFIPRAADETWEIKVCAPQLDGEFSRPAIISFLIALQFICNWRKIAL